MKKVIVVLAICFLWLGMLGIGEPARAEETIRFLLKTGGVGTALRGGVELFNQRFKGQYKVEAVYLPLEQLREKQVIQYFTNVPTFDVFAINESTVTLNFANLTNLDPYVKKAGIDMNQYGGLIGQCMYQDHVVVLPVRAGTEIIYYRKDWLKDAGIKVPDNWWVYREAARKLTKDLNGDGETDIYGDFLKMKDRWRSYQEFRLFVLENGLGGTVTNAPYAGAKVEKPGPNPWLLSEYVINRLKFMESYWREGLCPDPVANGFDENIWAVQQEKVAMSHMWSPRVLFIEDPEKSKAAGKMGYTILPTQQLGPKPYIKCQGPWRLGIPKNAQHKEAAFKFISFMASYEVQKYLAMNWQNGPTMLKVMDDPEYIKLNPSILAVKKAFSLHLGPDSPTEVKETEELQQIVHEELQKFALGMQTAEETARNIYNRIDEMTLTPAW